ncbi:hypothetical protein VDGD_06328 [Verticillium dahliae]|nr:hypothetical protein VDGD_06328 [Verticillium dahliae]
MDHSFDKTHGEPEQEPVFIDYFLDDPEQLDSTTPPLGQTPFFTSAAGSAVDHLQGGRVRHGGGDHAMPVGHRTIPTSAHPPLQPPPPPLPPTHLATEPRPRNHQQARHDRLLTPEPLFRGHHLQSPILGSGLHGNSPTSTTPSAIQPHHDDWALPDFSADSLAFPPPAEAFLEPPVGATNVIDFGLGAAATNHHDYTDNITPLPSHARTTLDHFDFDFAFPSPSWGPSLNDAMSSSLAVAVAVGAGTTSHPRSAMDDESDHRDTRSFWADEDSSSVGGRPSPSTAARKRLPKGGPKGKHRADSLDGASSSIFSTGSDDTGMSHAAGAADLSPGLPPRAGPGSGCSPSPGTVKTESSHHPGAAAAAAAAAARRRRSSRAKSVATTASASASASASSSNATPPSSDTRAPKKTATASTAARLRSASRASKNAARRPAESAEERRTRASHNLVEKQYRSRLNAQFEGLLNALPELPVPASQQQQQQQQQPADTAEDQTERRVSKAEVLERARLHIEALEREREALRREREELLRNLADMEHDVSVRMGEGALGDSLRASPATEEEEDGGQAEQGDK